MTAINCVTVSCVATASSRIVESNARLLRPRSTPVSVTTASTASAIRCGRSEAASRLRQYVNVDGSNPRCPTGSPVATFHRRSDRRHATASRSLKPCKACSTMTDATTSTGIDGRPRPEGPQVVEHHGREPHPPLISQQPEHRTRLDQMPSDRLSIQKLTLIKRTTLHEPIVPTLTPGGPDDTHSSAVS